MFVYIGLFWPLVPPPSLTALLVGQPSYRRSTSRQRIPPRRARAPCMAQAKAVDPSAVKFSLGEELSSEAEARIRALANVRREMPSRALLQALPALGLAVSDTRSSTACLAHAPSQAACRHGCRADALSPLRVRTGTDTCTTLIPAPALCSGRPLWMTSQSCIQWATSSAGMHHVHCPARARSRALS